MTAHYRALLSVPITAATDEDARRIADEMSLQLPDAHLELLGKTGEDSLQIARVIHAEALLLSQMPADWKP